MPAPYTSDVTLLWQKINARLSLMIIYSMETLRKIKVVPSAMSTRTLLLLTDIISMEDAFCQIVPCRLKMMPLILIPTRTTTQLMEKISLLFHLTTNIYSSKMEKNTTQIMLTKWYLHLVKTSYWKYWSTTMKAGYMQMRMMLWLISCSQMVKT